MKQLTLLIVFSIILLSIQLLLPFSALATTSNKEIDISSTPSSIYFNVTNLKPGDSITKTVTIHNQGKMDFSYLCHAYKESGSDMLYNQLQLEASMDGKKVYEGPLHQFTGMPARPLDHSTSEEMTLKVIFPWESGNEYQGLSAVAMIQLTAKGNTDSTTTDKEELDTVTVTSEDRGKHTLSILESSLPQTGETPPTLYYLIGGFLLMTGLGFYTTTVMRKRRE